MLSVFHFHLFYLFVLLIRCLPFLSLLLSSSLCCHLYADENDSSNPSWVHQKTDVKFRTHPTLLLVWRIRKRQRSPRCPLYTSRRSVTISLGSGFPADRLERSESRSSWRTPTWRPFRGRGATTPLVDTASHAWWKPCRSVRSRCSAAARSLLRTRFNFCNVVLSAFEEIKSWHSVRDPCDEASRPGQGKPNSTRECFQGSLQV